MCLGHMFMRSLSEKLGCVILAQKSVVCQWDYNHEKLVAREFRSYMSHSCDCCYRL